MLSGSLLEKLTMELTISSQSVLYSIIGIAFGIFILITVLRWWLSRSVNQDILDGETHNPYDGLKKYPRVDVMNYYSTSLFFGLFISLGIVVLLMSATQFERTNNNDFVSFTLLEEEIEIEPPRTSKPPPPPPPAPPPVITEVPNEEIIEEDQPIFEDQSVDEETVFEEVEIPEAPVEEDAPPPPPPPPPPMEEADVQEIFKVVEQMPLFGGCSDRACSDKAVMTYIQKNIKYPMIARENGVSGRVYVQFVVERDGSVTEITVVRDIGAGCGEAAAKVIHDMNSLAQGWQPGLQRGKAVRVLYTLPVSFTIKNT